MAAEEEASSPSLNPRSATSRLLECAKCFEPVATSGWSGRVRMRCGYCGFDDERELVLPEVSVDGDVRPYRDAQRPEERTGKLSFDLQKVLPGRNVLAIDAAMLRASFARRPLLKEDVASVEWERVWMAVWLALRTAFRGEHLRVRVALETTLEATKTPAYRAILLAHLAQHAAGQKATKLAKQWLRACPDLAIAEVDSEIRAARAMIALAKGDHDRVIELTGGRTAGFGYNGGAAVFLAIALQIEARERKGDRDGADVIFENVGGGASLSCLLVPMQAFGLGLASMNRVTAKRRKRAALTAAVFGGGPFLVGPLVNVRLAACVVAAVVFAVVAAAVSWWTLSWPTDTFPAKARRFVMRTLLPIGWSVAAAFWLARYERATPPTPPTPPPSADSAADPTVPD